MTCECLICGEKKKRKKQKSIKYELLGNDRQLFVSCRNVKGERGTGLFAVRNVSSCTTPACESRTRRRTMEVLGEDEKHSFLMKYTIFSGAIPLQSQAGVKVQSCLKRAAKPCCSAHAF